MIYLNILKREKVGYCAAWRCLSATRPHVSNVDTITILFSIGQFNWMLVNPHRAKKHLEASHLRFVKGCMIFKPVLSHLQARVNRASMSTLL